MVEQLKNLEFSILGVIVPRVDIPIVEYNNIDSKILRLCLLDEDDHQLTTKNISKLQLAKSLNNSIIILYDFSKGLNYKEINYFQRIFKKLVNKENKKIILISRDVNFLAKMCDHFAVYQNHLIYNTDDIFDDNLFKYIDMPQIVKFIKMSEKKGIVLNKTLDINELIKDIYRRRNESKTNF